MANVNIYDMADTWNNGATTFTAIKMDVTDTASASGSLLMDLLVGGSSKFSVNKIGGAYSKIITNSASNFTGERNNAGQFFEGRWGATFQILGLGANSGVPLVDMASTGLIRWSNSSLGISTLDLILARDAANTLGQRNSTNAQSFNLYNTYTDASNHERMKLGWNANAFEIKPEAAGTGTARVVHLSGLPTSNPGPGILWNNAGTPAIGT